MKSLFGKRGACDTAYLFDIGSQSVAAGRLGISKDGSVCIEDHIRIPASRRPAMRSRAIEAEYLGALRRAGESVRVKGQPLASGHIACFLSSRWHLPHTRRYTETFSEPRRITYDLLHGGIEEDIKVLERDVPPEIDEYVIIDRQLLEVRVNGYADTRPIGLVGNELSLDYFVSLANARFVEDIERTIRDVLGRRPDALHGSLYTLYRMLVAEQDSPDFSVIRLSSGATDAFTVRGGKLAAVGSMLFGIEELLKDVSAGTGLDAPHVQSLLSVVGSAAGGLALAERLRRPLEAAGAVWAERVYELFLRLSETFMLPPRLYVFIDPAYLATARAVLSIPEFAQLTLTGTPFEIIGPAHAFVPAISKVATGEHPDLFLALEAISLPLLEKTDGVI